MKSLYVSRPVMNWRQLGLWASQQGFNTYLGDDMHVTIIYSPDDGIPHNGIPATMPTVRVVDDGKRSVKALGDKGAIVLSFQSDLLQERHNQLTEAGAKHSYPQYTAHITITYDGEGVDLSKVEPFPYDIHLGPERYAEITGSFNPDDLTEVLAKAMRNDCKIEKADLKHGVVMGFAIVTKIDGEPYFDLQGDHITDEAVLEASIAFADNRESWDLHGFGKHGTKPIGKIVQMFALTEDVAKSMGIQTRKTGLMVMMKVDDDEILAKFADGSYTGFSIGGRELQVERLT